MKNINRRTFFLDSFKVVAALSLPHNVLYGKGENLISPVPEIIDTNVNLLEFPSRRFKYGKTKLLADKLRQHRITRAWAGSFESLLHKDIDSVNARLFEECRDKGKGIFLPFGTVNITIPDWEEDLRRCAERYHMPGIRVYPIYQAFELDNPNFFKLVKQVAERKMILQIVGDIEDIRHIHPIVNVRGLNFEPLVDIMKKVPAAKVQLVYWNNRIAGNLPRLITETNVMFDISRIEGNGQVGRMIDGDLWSESTNPVPVERLTFGSHAPYFPVETNILKLFESPLTLEQMTLIMNGNALRYLVES